MTTRQTTATIVFVAILLCPSLRHAQKQQPKGDPRLTEVWEPVPRVITPGIGTAPPSDAIVLFSGNDLSEWQHGDGSPAKWKIADGAFTLQGHRRYTYQALFRRLPTEIFFRAPRFSENGGVLVHH